MPADAQTFAAVASADRAKLINLCLGILRNPEDAEDAVQNGLTTAWRGIKHFRGDSSLSTWLYRAVQNAALNQLRRRKSHRENAHVELPANLPSSERSAERRVLAADRIRMVWIALESPRLSALSRDLLVSELSGHRDVNSRLLRVRRRRAIAALRVILEEDSKGRANPKPHGDGKGNCRFI